MKPPPPLRPPRQDHDERIFHTLGGPLVLRGPRRYLEAVRVIPLPRPGIDRPYDWRRDEVRVLPIVIVPDALR